MEITINAQFNTTGIFNKIGEPLDREETNISEKTWSELQQLVIMYEDIIIYDEEKMQRDAELIKELDAKGIAITQKIKNEWSYDLKTKEKIDFVYISEAYMTRTKIE